MEALVVPAALAIQVLLGYLALRHGHDSRDRADARSDQQPADDPTLAWVLAAELRAARLRRRHASLGAAIASVRAPRAADPVREAA